MNDVPRASVLRNRGVPMQMHVIEKDENNKPGTPYTRVYKDDEPVLETRWLKFTNAVLAAIEEHWGSIPEWQDANVVKPWKSITDTVAITLDLWTTGPDGAPVPDTALASALMQDGELENYSVALGAAYMLANGVNGDVVGESLRRDYRKTYEEARRNDDAVMEALKKEDEEGTDSEAAISGTIPIDQPMLPLGDDQPSPGSDSDEALTSSGA